VGVVYAAWPLVIHRQGAHDSIVAEKAHAENGRAEEIRGIVFGFPQILAIEHGTRRNDIFEYPCIK
jgi:hypothetical protein